LRHIFLGDLEMQRPTWFDYRYENELKNATPEAAVAIVAKDPQVLAAVRQALSEFDANPGRPGPSRSQAVRGAIAEVLSAEELPPELMVG
jgi:hypothetical protein